VVSRFAADRNFLFFGPYSFLGRFFPGRFDDGDELRVKATPHKECTMKRNVINLGYE
jgi:hypothetical protein